MGTVAANDKYSGALTVSLVRSRLLLAGVGTAALSTGVLLAATPLPLAATLLGLTWVACLALDAVRRGYGARLLAIDADGAIALDGMAGSVRAGCFVAPWLTVIRWRRAGAHLDRTLLVLPDMLAADDFRRLRVILRLRP